MQSVQALRAVHALHALQALRAMQILQDRKQRERNHCKPCCQYLDNLSRRPADIFNKFLAVGLFLRNSMVLV
jgi:hypothetical protein